MREVNPALTTTAIRVALQDSAIDVGARDNGAAIGSGYDSDSGAGLIVADAAPAAVEIAAPIWLPDAAAQANHDWQQIAAASGFPGPVVLAGPPTYHGSDPGVVRLRNIDGAGFSIRFQEWDYRQRNFGDTSHAVEDLSYVVLHPGRHVLSDGSIWEVGTFGLGGTRSWANVAFARPFGTPPKLFLTVETDNGNQAVTARARNLTSTGFQAALFEEEALNDGHSSETIGYLTVYSPSAGGVIDSNGQEIPYLLQSLAADERWVPSLSQRLKVEEERSLDSETEHVDETLHMIALGDQVLAQQVSDNGGDTAALRRLEPTTSAPMEWGIVRGIDERWQSLPFAKRYTNPVVIMKPTSSNGLNPGAVRLRNVDSTGAQLRFQEWNYLDGIHDMPEDIFYLVSEAGEHTLGGLTVDASTVVTNALGRAGQWQGVGFGAFFAGNPAVFASVMTYNGLDAVTTRISSLDPAGFDLAMDEQESRTDGHVNETLGWIAIETGNGTTSDDRQVRVFFDQLDDALTTVTFPTVTGHRYPTVVGDIDSAFGMDTVSLRYANPTNSQIDLRLAEEQSADSETEHVVEDVGIFVGN